MLTRASRVRPTVPLGVGVALTALTLPLVLALPAAADEEGDGARVRTVECSAAAQDEENLFRAPVGSAPLAAMQIPEVHDRYATGDGVGVAVIDSGVATTTGFLDDVQLGQPQVRPSDDLEEELPGRPSVEHGTIVAGLIAGRRDPESGSAGGGAGGDGMGVAPDADLYSIRVVGSLSEQDDFDAIPDDQFAVSDVVAGLEWVAREARRRDIAVVNLSLTAPPSPALEAAVEAVREQDVIVVAATGNRSASDPLPEGEYDPMEPDAARFPAAYDGVVGVGAFVPRELGPAQQFVLSSDVVDVAAPTVGAVSTVPTGSSCVLPLPATSWSTAYVSGALALLAERFDDETPEQLVARLLRTASGASGTRSRFTGAGVIQPLEAMTRDLSPSRDGAVDGIDRVEDEGVAQAPPVRGDQLAASRDDFRWWGLLAGAVLVAAVILRPLLRRLRRS